MIWIPNRNKNPQ